MKKTILHIDMNSYFATVEQQANVAYRGKPLGIVKAEGRGCIIAASVEAKKFGVKTGCVVWEAKKLCPQIILVPSDMDKYFSVTKDLMRIISDYSPIVEIFSIDECFLDITSSEKLFTGGAFEIAMILKERIKKEIGDYLKCSIGISFSKLLAKLASELNKPNGVTFLTEESFIRDTENVDVGEVCGIGRARTKWLESRGAYTLGQARLLPDLPEDISDLVWLRLDEAMETVADLDPAKSVSRTFTTFKTLNSKSEILNLVRNLIEEVCIKMREMNMVGRTFCLSLRSGNPYLTPSPLLISREVQSSFWIRKTINDATDDPLIIFDLLWKEFLKNPIENVRFAGVSIANLSSKIQIPINKNRENLLKATDRVNSKYGLFTLYPAILTGGELIRPEVTGYLGDKYYRFKAETSQR